MAKYRFRFPFHIPSSTRLTGDPFELDYTWKSHPVHILVKGYGSSSGSDNRSYDCCGREFDTPQEALECAVDAERRLTRAALSLGLGINLWTDREPGQIVFRVLSMGPAIVPGRVYADSPGVCVYEGSDRTSFLRMTVSHPTVQCTIEELGAGFGLTKSGSHEEVGQDDLALLLASMACFEPEPSARFLMLTFVLDILGKQVENTGPINELIGRFICEADAEIDLTPSEHDEVRNRLRELKKVSHVATIRNMIGERIPGKVYANQQAPAFGTACYSKRGRMLHDGEGLAGDGTTSLLPELEKMVYDLLEIPQISRGR